MENFKRLLSEDSFLEADLKEDKKLLTEVSKKLKLMRQDAGTNNFRGAVITLKNLLEDYLS
jgi:hypothetical protein